MRLVILAMCVLVVVGVFGVMFVSIWSTRLRDGAHASVLRRSLAVEFVWAAIPCLMLLAAAVPAVIAIVSGHTGD